MNIRRIIILLILILALTVLFRSKPFNEVWLKVRVFVNDLSSGNKMLDGLDADIETFSEMDKKNARVDINELVTGSRKDGIPAINDPKFKTIKKTSFTDEDLVIGVEYKGEAKAYPYKILDQHEIVNDSIGGLPIAVTYCPLCDTNPVFKRIVGAEETTFGVSGKLYQNCLVMYDSNTNTYWSQPWGMGIIGQNVNIALERIPAFKTTLGAWKRKHPGTLVLSKNTGFIRNYSSSPYKSYTENDNLLYPARNQDLLLTSPKKEISYIWEPGNDHPTDEFSGYSAYLSHEFVKENGEVDMVFDGDLITAIWDKELGTVIFNGVGGQYVPASTAYAFVYPAFFE